MPTDVTAPVTDLVFDHVSLSFGNTVVLRDLSFRVPVGTTMTLMGASGGGKTSILRLAARLIRPDSGTVTGGGRVSMQFQEPRLLPWLTAAENINAVLSDTKQTLPLALSWLERVGLSSAAALYPEELSGGMAQRVSLCRALAAPHDLLLLDEPFRGLDGETKGMVMAAVKAASVGRTLLLVTHDPDEAAFFGGDCMEVLKL